VIIIRPTFGAFVQLAREKTTFILFDLRITQKMGKSSSKQKKQHRLVKAKSTIENESFEEDDNEESGGREENRQTLFVFMLIAAFTCSQDHKCQSIDKTNLASP
jgi:hypothetical protein